MLEPARRHPPRDGAVALTLYESGWRHVDEASLTAEERQLIDELVARYGHGVLNV